MREEVSEATRTPVRDAGRGSGNRHLVFNARPQFLPNEPPLAVSGNRTRDYCKYVHVQLAFFSSSALCNTNFPGIPFTLQYGSYPAGQYYQTECLLPVPPYNLPPVFMRPAQPFF